MHKLQGKTAYNYCLFCVNCTKTRCFDSESPIRDVGRWIGPSESAFLRKEKMLFHQNPSDHEFTSLRKCDIVDEDIVTENQAHYLFHMGHRNMSFKDHWPQFVENAPFQFLRHLMFTE